jgi:hypothetical protein
VLQIGEKIQLRPYVDSSFGIYGDAKSMTEVVIMLGNAQIHVNSGMVQDLPSTSFRRENSWVISTLVFAYSKATSQLYVEGPKLAEITSGVTTKLSNI